LKPKRRTVRCWFCGNKKRRVPSTRGIPPSWLDERGRVKVILRKRTVVPYGACGAMGHPWEPDGCRQPMLLPKDVRFVLRAALQYDRGGGNHRSEYDVC